MPRHWTYETKRGQLYVRVSCPDGSRPRVPIATRDDAKADELARVARARVEAELAAVVAGRLTVQQFGELWTSGQLYTRHGEVRGLRPKKSADVDAYRLGKYVYPALGSKPVADVEELDVERVMAEAQTRSSKPLRAATRNQIFQVMRRLFDLAIRPGRLRTDSPVPADLRPRKDDPKLYGYLFPDELLALLRCAAVPLGRRVLYAMGVYMGLRGGSLYALEWPGFDALHRVVTSRRSKTGLPQLFELQPTLSALLERWWERCGRPTEGPIVRDVGVRRKREAEALRADLEAAGVTRRELLAGDDVVQRLRFHDLRATFVTWALREGRGLLWIQDRTGHLTEDQVGRYSRAARTLADLSIVAFPELVVPELAELPGNVVAFRRGS